MSRILILILVISLFPLRAHAVLPPDMIFSVGSQISQIFAAVSIFIAGFIISIGPFFERIINKFLLLPRWIRILGVILVISVSSIFLYKNIFINQGISSHTKPTTLSPTTESTQVGYHFYSDRFVLVSKNVKGEPLLIDLIINRKENSTKGFDHYYLGNIISGTNSEKFYKEGFSQSPDVLHDVFFSTYKKVKAGDHSSRDTYTFSFVLSGKNYTVETDELLSDFITKNEIEYTSYVSSGNAKITVGGDTFTTHIMHQGTYSNDYRPKIFFDSKGEIRSETIQLILWDDKNNFYLVDRSKVFEVSDAYSSHLWALFKNTSGMTHKAFEGVVNRVSTKTNTTFAASIPHFDFSTITAELTHRFAKKQDKGWVEATVELPTGTVSAYGLGYYHEYGLGNPLQ